jgi:hypothetical protein
VTEPVVIRLFTKADGTPYTLVPDEFDEWTVYANMYIYFVSDFVRLNETTTLPTTLPAGQQVWYIDPNGVETLWVGRQDGSAWPAVGYKEYVAQYSVSGSGAPVISGNGAVVNTLGTVTTSGTGGAYIFQFSAPGALPFGELKVMAFGVLSQSYVSAQISGTKYFITGSSDNNITQSSDVGRFNVALYNTLGSQVSPDVIVIFTVSIKYYGLKP